jgi:hypothetical protein
VARVDQRVYTTSTRTMAVTVMTLVGSLDLWARTTKQPACYQIVLGSISIETTSSRYSRSCSLEIQSHYRYGPKSRPRHGAPRTGHGPSPPSSPPGGKQHLFELFQGLVHPPLGPFSGPTLLIQNGTDGYARERETSLRCEANRHSGRISATPHVSLSTQAIILETVPSRWAIALRPACSGNQRNKRFCIQQFYHCIIIASGM